MWQDILTSILTSSVITGIFVLILNKAIENKFDMKLEAYKDKLKFASDKELMQLTKDLDSKASEYSIKLSEVFKDQTRIIAEVFRNLLAFRGAIDAFTQTSSISDFDEKETALSCCLQALGTFNAHFTPNEIYIPSDTAEKIKQFAKSLRDIFIKHHIIDKMETSPKPPAMTEQRRGERIFKIYDEISAIEVQIEPLLKELKRDFQKILGIPIPK